jgi:hypothetical protein
MYTWHLQEAKTHFSEVIKKAVKKPKSPFVEFIRSSPLMDTKIELRRKKDYPREIDL